ncbi:MAG: hypothetical protein ACOYUK_00280 [Patescibacteria group bacterium]
MQQATQTKTRGITVTVIGLLSIGLFIFGFLPSLFPNDCASQIHFLSKTLGITKKCDTQSTQTPLVINDIQEFSTDMFDQLSGEPTIPACDDGAALVFHNGQANLGSFLSTQLTNPAKCILTAHDGETTSTGQTLSLTAVDGDFPRSQHITIRSAGNQIVTLCVDGLVNGESRFFDTYGTPYIDSALTQSALDEPCPAKLARGMVVNVYNAGTSTFYPENFDYHAIVRGSFWDNIWEFGYLYPLGFDREGLCADCYLRAYGQAPLAIAPHPKRDGDDLATPPDFLTLWDSEGNVKNVCMPSVMLPGAFDSEITYIDVQGNAYRDALLSDPYLNFSCSQIQERSFHPDDLSNIGLSALIDTGTIIFHRAIIGDSTYQMGNFHEHETESGDFERGFQDDNALQGQTGSAPLTIAYQNKYSETTITIPKQVFTIMSDQGTITTCAESVDLSPSETKLLYVASNGNTYTDPLLQNSTTPVDCALLLEHGFRPNLIITATAANLPDGTAIAFGRGDVYQTQTLGLLTPGGYTPGTLLAESPMLQGAAPLLIGIQNLTENPISVPQLIINLTTDIGTKDFCIPSRLTDPGATLYYAHNYGTVFQDPLLQNQLPCE